jgi:hypothetical protein
LDITIPLRVKRTLLTPLSHFLAWLATFCIQLQQLVWQIAMQDTWVVLS